MDELNASVETPDSSPSAVGAKVRPSAQPAFDQVWGAVFAESASAVRSVLFTAAGRKEGVSTLVAGAAITGASIHYNRRIALIDLNLRYPQLARLLGANPEPGLADVLAGRATLDQVAQPVASANLTLYPSGARPDAALPVVAGDKLRDLIAQLAERHDYLLCDCSAANLFPDAQILAPLFDGVVLVAQAGATRREALAEAKKRIELGRGRVLGVVLNKRRYPVPRFLYSRS